MGQQQLLLIVLGVIIVGIAVAVGINMFQSSAVDANRNAIISDLAHLSSKAQQHYKKPTTLGGGSQDFNGFGLGTLDRSNDNGAYRIASATVAATAATAAPAATGGAILISASTDTMYIAGYGVETGNDGTNLVQAYVQIYGNGFTTEIVN